MKLALLSLLLLAPLDEIDDAKKELQDRSYGNYWDRLDACRGLGRGASVRAAEVLVGVLDDPELALREAAVVSLAKMKTPEVRKWLLDLLPKLKEETKRANLLWSFRVASEKEAVPAALNALKDSSPLVRAEAARLLFQLADGAAAEALEKNLKDSSVEAREQTIFAYAQCKGAEAAGKLEDLLKDSQALIRAAALLAIARAGGLKAEQLAAAAKDKAIELRIAAAEASVSLGSEVILETSKTLIDDKEWRVRVAAVEALEEAWDKRAIGLLVERLSKEDGRLRLDIVTALQNLTGKELGFDGKAWKAWWEANKDPFPMPQKPERYGSRKPRMPTGTTKASFFNIPLLSKRLVFIIDFSGSMKNEDEIYQNKRKIDVAFEELEKAIGSIEDGAKANVLVLSTEATVQKKRLVAPRLVEVNAGNRKKIVDFVRGTWQALEKIKRGRGDIYDAIVEAFQDPEVDTVLLLSDGKPTYGKYLESEHIIDSLREIHRYRRVAVHTILIGSKGIDRPTMEGTAEVTRAIFMPRK